MTPNNRALKAVIGCISGAAIVSLAFYLMAGLPEVNVPGQKHQEEMMQATLTRLQKADNTQEKVHAVRWIGQQGQAIDSNVLHTLSLALTTDPDPTVRSSVARSFGEIAARQAAKGDYTISESLMLE